MLLPSQLWTLDFQVFEASELSKASTFVKRFLWVVFTKAYKMNKLKFAVSSFWSFKALKTSYFCQKRCLSSFPPSGRLTKWAKFVFKRYRYFFQKSTGTFFQTPLFAGINSILLKRTLYQDEILCTTWWALCLWVDIRIDVSSWSRTYGTAPTSNFHSSGCVGASADVAGAVYDVIIPRDGNYIVTVRWGYATYYQISYVQWDSQGTSDSYILWASDILEGEPHQVMSSAPVYLSAGSHSLYIGSNSDGGHYTTPWCDIVVTSTDPTSPPTPQPSILPSISNATYSLVISLLRGTLFQTVDEIRGWEAYISLFCQRNLVP